MKPYKFGNFMLLERISHGGMAEVFHAKSYGEAGFEREVALKLLLPSMASDEEFVNMLIDEAKIAGQLNHANIAQIFDLGQAEGRYYIVQEYVRGQDLRTILKHKSQTKTFLPVSTACHVALKVCEGLYYAHNRATVSGKPLKLVHRDISPHNVVISTQGEVKIIDFGIAKAEGRSTQTMAGLVKGKFAYMSPEQIRGLPVDHRSDVFATGILLHEMLTSRSLFRRATEFETLKRARAATAEPPSRFNPQVPPELDAVVLKALARHVEDRYQSARELRDALWHYARESNAFADAYEENSQAPEKPDGTVETDLSVEIELASEVRLVEEITNQHAAESDEAWPDPNEEATRVSDFDFSEQSSEDSVDAPLETMVDPSFAISEPEDYSEPSEGTFDEGSSGNEDEQWAANLQGPLPPITKPTHLTTNPNLNLSPDEASPASTLRMPGAPAPELRPTRPQMIAPLPAEAFPESDIPTNPGSQGEETFNGAGPESEETFTNPGSSEDDLVTNPGPGEEEALTNPGPDAVNISTNERSPYDVTTANQRRKQALGIARTEPVSKEALLSGPSQRHGAPNSRLASDAGLPSPREALGDAGDFLPPTNVLSPAELHRRQRPSKAPPPAKRPKTPFLLPSTNIAPPPAIAKSRGKSRNSSVPPSQAIPRPRTENSGLSAIRRANSQAAPLTTPHSQSAILARPPTSSSQAVPLPTPYSDSQQPTAPTPVPEAPKPASAKLRSVRVKSSRRLYLLILAIFVLGIAAAATLTLLLGR